METDDQHSKRIADVLSFRDASELLRTFNELMPTLSAADAVDIIRSPTWLTVTTTPFVYAKLQVAACLIDFFIIVDNSSYELIEPAYTETLSFVLTAILAPKTTVDRRRLDSYIKVLTFFFENGVAKSDVARELFLRGGIERVLATCKATHGSSNLANLQICRGRNG